ncbi:MAG TPA: hypothetical protein PKI34_12295, partial [Bacteroidales bacterium]|nr:hypothetical protein [Bacteroidales bacterium]
SVCYVDKLANFKFSRSVVDTYYKKISKAASPIVAMQFFQVEAYILAAIRLYILEEVPFVKK